jgi:hypothetical protein
MATTVAILGLVSVNYLTNASVGLVESNQFLGVSRGRFLSKIGVFRFSINHLGLRGYARFVKLFFWKCDVSGYQETARKHP